MADFVTEADGLWPAHPENVDKMEKWLDKAKQLAQRLDIHKQTLAALQEKALPLDEAAELNDVREHYATDKKDLAAILEEGKTETEDGRTLEHLRKHLKELPAKIADLEKAVAERRAWKFADTEEQWQHDTLDGLVRGLEDFASDDPKVGVIKSVERRLDFARAVRKKTIDEYRAKWDEAIASIANENECPKYKGLRITPQLGLTPIGRDPQSGLWEFAHLQTGASPVRGEDGKLKLAEETGLVFVLIPGGTFEMGSPESEAGRRNDEGPIHAVMLAPFFLSKYEMTQAQWQRFTGASPSVYAPGAKFGNKTVTLLDPVENVSWDDCTRVVKRLGLVLPTEAQWEYAARAGTKTAWWVGEDPKALQRAANLAEAFCKANGGPPNWTYESWNDGYTVHRIRERTCCLEGS